MGKKTTLVYLALLICICLQAQVQTPFNERFSGSLEGGVTIIANNNLSRDRVAPYNQEGDNHDAPSVYVDIDNDQTTFNSSNAEFKNPEVTEPCISILRAFLYWAGATSRFSTPNWDFNEVKLRLPGEVDYNTITADDVIFDGTNGQLNNRPFVCFKDLTDTVQALGEDIYGIYQIANIAASEGRVGSTGASAGWQIVFIYESPELPAKNITLFDGYAHIEPGIFGPPPTVDIDFDGFITVPQGPVGGDVVMGALEGDRSLVGDNLLIRNIAGNFVDLVAPLRPNTNFFNSRITVGNGDFLDRNPASTNALGFDAAVFELNNPNNTILDNNSTATTLRITSASEVYGLYLLGLAVEIFRPNLDPMLITQTTGSPTPNPGDIIGFNFNLENRGNDDAINVTLRSTLPQQIVFQPPVALPAGITFNYNQQTNELVFMVANGVLDVGDPAIGIDMEFRVKDDCFFLEEDCDLDFEIQFEASFNGVTNPDDPLISISTVDPSTCVDTPVIINIIQPPINWATAPLDLDRILSCEDVTGLEAAQLLAPITDKCDPFRFITLNRIPGPFVPEPDCPNAGTYTNRWNFTDECGVTIADYIQTITIEDVIPPTATNPETLNVQCLTDVPLEDPSVVIDEADNCSEPTVSFVSQVSDGQTCPETITRVYRVTDACGNSTEVTHVVEVNDTIAPTASNLPPLAFQCREEVPQPDTSLVDAADNCSTPQVAFVSDISNGTCPEIITRTYSVTDGCNNSINVTQIITVNDDIAPELISPLETSISISCDLIPEIPVLEFSDNCTPNVSVDFNETTVTIDEENYTIIRTWNISDDCGNGDTFTQEISVETINLLDTEQLNFCVDEPSIDLNTFINNTDVTSENWETSFPDLLNGSIFNPSSAQVGDYEFTYTYVDAGSCEFKTIVNIAINDDCIRCVKTITEDISISKLVTPNNDGVNDFLEVDFNIKNSNARLCAFSISLDIYNRWGVRVYSNENYDNSWRGEAPSAAVGNSEQLPTGTYYYIVKFKDTAEEVKPIQGFILLGSSI